MFVPAQKTEDGREGGKDEGKDGKEKEGGKEGKEKPEDRAGQQQQHAGGEVKEGGGGSGKDGTKEKEREKEVVKEDQGSPKEGAGAAKAVEDVAPQGGVVTMNRVFYPLDTTSPIYPQFVNWCIQIISRQMHLQPPPLPGTPASAQPSPGQILTPEKERELHRLTMLFLTTRNEDALRVLVYQYLPHTDDLEKFIGEVVRFRTTIN